MSQQETANRPWKEKEKIPVMQGHLYMKTGSEMIYKDYNYYKYCVFSWKIWSFKLLFNFDDLIGNLTLWPENDIPQSFHLHANENLSPWEWWEFVLTRNGSCCPTWDRSEGWKAVSCWEQVWDVVINVILRDIFLNLKLKKQTVLCSHMHFTRLCQNLS